MKLCKLYMFQVLGYSVITPRGSDNYIKWTSQCSRYHVLKSGSAFTTGVAPRPDRVKIRPLLDMNDLIGLEFRLSMIQTSDSGTYECRAQNGGGAHVVTKTVSITVRPRPATVAPSTAVPQA